jgi:2-haloacid dehalogenase/putative hydrolase of the HAD superfamily
MIQSAFDIITFDCYGTLIDWETGISRAFIDAARADGVQLERDEVVRVYHDIEPALQAEQYRPYRDVLGEAARLCASQLGWSLASSRTTFLAQSLEGWPPFPDTNPALEQLRGLGYRLGILSNIDDGLLAGTLRHFSVEFDLVVTAEQVRSYKPKLEHFNAAREHLEGERWLHAAQSYFHDIVPATELDVPVVWVNRKGEQPSGEARPDGEVASLEALVKWLSRPSATPV